MPDTMSPCGTTSRSYKSFNINLVVGEMDLQPLESAKVDLIKGAICQAQDGKSFLQGRRARIWDRAKMHVSLASSFEWLEVELGQILLEHHIHIQLF